MNFKTILFSAVFFLIWVYNAAFGFSIPYSNSWSMGKNCHPEGLWALTQERFFSIEFLSLQSQASEYEMKRLESLRLMLLADLRYAQSTFEAKLSKLAQENIANGRDPAFLVDMERTTLQSEISFLNTMIISIPKEIEYYSSCSVKINEDLGALLQSKCGFTPSRYTEALKLGYKNKEILAHLRAEKICL